ncbi:S-adenosyl-L-methionine-dependent methyltransferase [Rhodocollybia butyracea]|uniref:S-adenosyl-L-methionine-dependent methyltransferase n=1 Tax=Rhodocollybia butyracea TaxID=206335 RepID=A0A9P5PWG5_9AGAR|nr:S-adenosyl-L-methionine-dependent methyltransferase [Rhodocollybia butyracea]
MDILPELNEQYSTIDYWNQRYSQEADDASFDWFKSYSEVAEILGSIIPEKSCKILMLGCGNSKLSEDMYNDGYKNIVNIDYSSVVINKMKERHPHMEWHEMDVRDLQFEDESFDIAIDKGTMDALMTVKGDIWNPPQKVIDDCNQEVSEVIRILRKEKGIFIYLTFGQPHFRKRHLTREQSTLEVRELGEAFHYYLYILRTES